MKTTLRQHILGLIAICIVMEGCSKETSTIKVVISNPDLEVKTASLIQVTDNIKALQGLVFPWERWFTTSYSFSKVKPAESNTFYLNNIKQGTYSILIAAEVENDDFAYGGQIEEVQIYKQTTEVKIELSQLRRYFSFPEEQETDQWDAGP